MDSVLQVKSIKSGTEDRKNKPTSHPALLLYPLGVNWCPIFFFSSSLQTLAFTSYAFLSYSMSNWLPESQSVWSCLPSSFSSSDWRRPVKLSFSAPQHVSHHHPWILTRNHSPKGSHQGLRRAVWFFGFVFLLICENFTSWDFFFTDLRCQGWELSHDLWCST